MRILVIESDATTTAALKNVLESASIVATFAASGEEGFDLASVYEYDMIVSDLVLSDMDGVDLIRDLRAKRVTIPVLSLSGSADVANRVRAFRAGADDVVNKPFHAEEIVARVNAIVRRYRGQATSVVSIGDMEINIDNQTVTVADQRVKLTGKEYQILEVMALRRDVTLTKDMLLNHLYGGMDEPEIKIIDVFVCKLRKKLSAVSNNEYIETVWGRGYALRNEPKALNELDAAAA